MISVLGDLIYKFQRMSHNFQVTEFIIITKTLSSELVIKFLIKIRVGTSFCENINSINTSYFRTGFGYLKSAILTLIVSTILP